MTGENFAFCFSKMYGTTHGSFPKKQKPSGAAGYLARPKLGAYRSLYPLKSLRPSTGYNYEKRKKARKSNESKMEYRRRPDYADTAYREAVSRLKVLLADSYAPIKRPIRELDSAGEETDNQSLMSGASRNSRPSHLHYRYSPSIPKRYPYYTPSRTATVEPDKSLLTDTKWEHPDFPTFVERQEDYIDQLEKESKFCRDELATLLRKVKDVISENEDLHEKQKSSLIKSVFNRLESETETETESDIKKCTYKSPKRSRRHIALEGPTIVFESRISELEAQLTQAKIDLRKSIDENESFKRKLADGSLSDGAGLDTHRKQIESLQRDKGVLQDTVAKLQSVLAQFKDQENISCDQIKRSLDAAEQAQYEKNAAELEIRRLKDELERQHGKLRDAIGEHSRRISDERSAMERRYAQQIDQLTTDLGVQWETTSKVQLELEKQRRDNSDLRRELAQKQAYVDELKKEMHSKISTMQSDIGLSGAEKSALEQQIATQQLSNERIERQNRQEVARLQAELQSLRQRLDRSDADLIHSRRENIRLSEQIASLEKEINLNVALSEERGKRGGGSGGGGDIIALPAPSARDDREKELSTMVKDMETKHAATVAELETMIHSQNQLMDKLTGECQALTVKLEDASTRHKNHRYRLRTENKELMNRLQQVWILLKETHDTTEDDIVKMRRIISQALKEPFSTNNQTHQTNQ
ncbi:serologically defined colon cancer antigen 8 homolog isoform X3 [Photinus pyralis]|uniref:serologically defined colon cancer antigen 8 homolog isoform X3 n=1 Tax=Photinus pyralis TaxID=7054 RepID=UPI001266E840|nr:serologically defined colon cancer antigen 8 homolog isoform X3 [Photinus pyralis]